MPYRRCVLFPLSSQSWNRENISILNRQVRFEVIANSRLTTRKADLFCVKFIWSMYIITPLFNYVTHDDIVYSRLCLLKYVQPGILWSFKIETTPVKGRKKAGWTNFISPSRLRISISLLKRDSFLSDLNDIRCYNNLQTKVFARMHFNCIKKNCDGLQNS